MDYYYLRDDYGAVTLKREAVVRWGLPPIPDDVMLLMGKTTAEIMARMAGGSVRIERMPAEDRTELEKVMRGRGVRFWALVEKIDETTKMQFSFFDLNDRATALPDGQHRHPRSNFN